MENEVTEIFTEEKFPEKSTEKKKRGIRITFGRCFDFFLIAIYVAAILISLIAFICLAVIIGQSIDAAGKVGLSSKQACLLFADGVNDTITFAQSDVCYYILASPPVIWCFTAFSIIFLIFKIWRTWNLGFFEIVIYIVSILGLIYAVIASLVLTVGHSFTCKNVARLDVPGSDEKQSCLGGVHYKADDPTGVIQIEGYFFVSEIALWITSVILMVISILHCSRLCVFSRRRSKRAEMAKATEV